MNLDLTDPRTIRALLIAADSGQWMRLRTRDGEVAYGIPSARGNGRYYVVTATSCDCEDARRQGLTGMRVGVSGAHFACKHQRAVQLYEALVRAVHDKAPATARQRRHLYLVGGSA